MKGFETEPEEIYPHESVVEVYDSGTLPYIEIEVHSPLKILNPGAIKTPINREHGRHLRQRPTS